MKSVSCSVIGVLAILSAAGATSAALPGQVVRPTAAAGGAAAAMHAQAARSTKDRIYTSAQAAQGRDIYDGRCKSCHTAISHTGPPFRANWDKRPLVELYNYMLEKMPKDAPGTLSSDEYTLVLAYILRMNGMPAGQDDLPSDKKALKSIRIDAPAPRGPL